MNDVLRALHEVSAILERMELPYAVIGGLAVRAYGIPRPTFDVDFTTRLPREKLAEFYEYVEAVGHSVLASYRSGGVDQVAGMPLIKLRTYIEGQGVDVDLFLAESEYQQELILRRQQVETPDGNLWLASAEDIVLLKLLAHRERDILDVLDVMFAYGQLDEAYLRKWADILKITSHLEEVLARGREMS